MSVRTSLPSIPGSPADTDLVLVTRVRGGDLRAWDTLFARYRRLVYRRVREYGRNADAAEDLAIIAWENAWKALPRYQERAGFVPWIMRILKNVAADDARRRRRRVEALVVAAELQELGELLTTGAGNDPEARLLARERAQALEAALGALRREAPRYWEAVQSGWLEAVFCKEKPDTNLERVVRHRALRWLRTRLLRDQPHLFAGEGSHKGVAQAQNPLALPPAEVTDGQSPRSVRRLPIKMKAA
ncbi:MAG: RNA polymerase sigma factor [Actinomycetota bacterium]